MNKMSEIKIRKYKYIKNKQYIKKPKTNVKNKT